MDDEYRPIPSRQPGYNAVYGVIRHYGTDAYVNAIIWRAVEAFADAMNLDA